MVHAGGAADAAQHLLELGAQHGGAAIVHQHHVIFLRPVQVAGAAGAGGEGGVDGKILPRRGTRQQAQQRTRILQGGHHFLDAGDGDVHARQGLRQVAIALIRHDDGGAGFRDQEIRPGDADIGGEEFFPQFRARLRQDVAALAEHAVGRQVGVGFAELFLPVLQVQMEGRGDDVARQFVAQLDDVLA